MAGVGTGYGLADTSKKPNANKVTLPQGGGAGLPATTTITSNQSSTNSNTSSTSTTSSQKDITAGSTLANQSNNALLSALGANALQAQQADKEAVNAIVSTLMGNTPNFDQAMAVIQGLSNQTQLDILANTKEQIDGSIGAAGGFGNTAATALTMLANQGIGASASNAMAQGINGYIQSQGDSLGQAAAAINGQQVNPMLEALLTAQKVSTDMQQSSVGSSTAMKDSATGSNTSSGARVTSNTTGNSGSNGNKKVGVSTNPAHEVLKYSWTGGQ